MPDFHFILKIFLKTALRVLLLRFLHAKKNSSPLPYFFIFILKTGDFNKEKE